MAADVSLRAADCSEFLKAQQQLLEVLYPSVEESGQLGKVEDSRWAEFAGYSLLYFSCTAGPSESSGLEVAMTLSRIPQKLLRSPPVLFARQVMNVLSQGNYVALFRMHGNAPEMSQLLMEPRLAQFREDTLLVLFKAYKIFPCSSLQNVLGLGEMEGGMKELKRLLTVLAERDNKAAALAVASWDGEIAPSVITFK